jgi:hypothetical protein
MLAFVVDYVMIHPSAFDDGLGTADPSTFPCQVVLYRTVFVLATSSVSKSHCFGLSLPRGRM